MTTSINRQEALHQFKLALKAGQKCYRDCVHRGRDLADAVQSLGALADAAVKAELDGMVGGQRQNPCRDMKLQLGQRELVEDRLEDIPHRRVVQLQAVDRQTAHAIV